MPNLIKFYFYLNSTIFSPQDFQILKGKSKFLNEGMWEMALTSNSLDTANPSFGQYLSKSIPMMTDLALRHLKLPRKDIQGLEVQPKKLIIMEPGQTLLINPTSNRRGTLLRSITRKSNIQCFFI